MCLVDQGLYDRKAPEIRNIPEERAMRYSAVLLSMLSDRVEDLEAKEDDAMLRTAKLEVVMDKTLSRQDELH